MHNGLRPLSDPYNGGRMIARLAARPVAPTLVWLATAAIALLGSLVVGKVALPIAAAGAAVALTMLDAPLPTRLLTGLAMAPVAFIDSSPPWAWAGAAAMIGLATALYPLELAGQLEVNGDLQRHLAWFRRREEPAHLLLVPVAGIDEQELSSALESFRITDSVSLGRGGGGSELYALLDAHGFVREGLERRLAERLDGRRFGWATFPEDGVTLQTLVDHARDAMRDREQRAARARAIATDGALVSADGPGHAPGALEHATGRS